MKKRFVGENSFSFRKKQKSFPPHPLSEKENPKLNLDILAAALFDAVAVVATAQREGKSRSYGNSGVYFWKRSF